MQTHEELRVIILWGEDEVADFYNYAKWTEDNAAKILDHTDVYEFDTEAEAEAFRLGLCAVKAPTARDFTELTERSYRALCDILSPPKRKAA